MILGSLNINYTKNDIDFKNAEHKTYKSFYEFICESLQIDNAIVWIRDNLRIYPVYLDELRVDYVNKEIYFPIYRYDSIDDVTYNHRIEKLIIHSFENDKMLGSLELFIQPNNLQNKVYKVDILDNTLGQNQCTEARELWQRYLQYCYGYGPYDIDIFKYNQIKKSDITNKQRKYLNEHSLEFYGQFEDMDYRDVRNYKLTELQRRFSDDDLGIELQYGRRRILFELELYIGIYNKVYWKNWSLGTIEDLLIDKREYVKYKENNVSLIFKGKWLK